MPPPQQAPSLDEPRIVDTVGESDDGRSSDPGGDLVDDLRRGSKPSSNRPRNQIGPLGIEDLRAEPPANSVGSDRPRTLNVVEINASESPRHDPFGDEITTQSPHANLFDEQDQEEEEDPLSAIDRELAREYALDDLRPVEPEVDDDRPSLLSVRDMLARRDPYDTQDAMHSLSSVLGARPSLRPSPQPERPRDSASVLWWLVVAALVAIIAAAGAIAAREQFARDDEESAPVAPVQQEPVAEPVVEPSKPAVSFGTPQTPEPAKLAPVAAPAPSDPKAAQEADRPRSPASPAAPNVVPPSQSAAARAGAPNTSVVTGAAATARPVVPGPAASAVKPTAAKVRPALVQPRAEQPVGAAPTAPAANYAPGYGKTLDGTPYAPGYNPASDPSKPALRPGPDATRGKPNLTPANESRDNELPGLPINPYE